MNNNNAFNRHFLYFTPEDKGFESGGSINGYIKLESRNGKGRLSVFIQNMFDSSGSYVFRLYLLSCAGESITPVFVSIVRPERNRVQFDWNFDADNVGGSRLGIEDFNTAVILAEYENRSNRHVICPLAAYKGTRTDWRIKLSDLLYGEKRQEAQVPKTIPEKMTDTMELAEDIQEEIPQDIQEEIPENVPEANLENIVEGDTDYAPEISPEQLQETSDNKESLEQLEGSEEAGQKLKSDTYTVTFDKYLERCDPFHTGRRDYIWWKVGSPYYLNTILYWMNVRSSLLLNPSIFNAACKYGHMIVGVYSNFRTNDKYLVFGVPGRYGTEMKPLGEYGRWAQVDLTQPEYNSFGYWIIYMNPYNSSILN